MASQDDYTGLADDLSALGARPPCLLNGGPYLPVAYYMGCSSDGYVSRLADAQRVVLLVYPGQQLPGFAAHWHAHLLHGIKMFNYVAYMP